MHVYTHTHTCTVAVDDKVAAICLVTGEARLFVQHKNQYAVNNALTTGNFTQVCKTLTNFEQTAIN